MLQDLVALHRVNVLAKGSRRWDMRSECAVKWSNGLWPRVVYVNAVRFACFLGGRRQSAAQPAVPVFGLAVHARAVSRQAFLALSLLSAVFANAASSAVLAVALAAPMRAYPRAATNLAVVPQLAMLANTAAVALFAATSLPAVLTNAGQTATNIWLTSLCLLLFLGRTHSGSGQLVSCCHYLWLSDCFAIGCTC